MIELAINEELKHAGRDYWNNRTPFWVRSFRTGIENNMLILKYNPVEGLE